jgi:hypothetical protein
MANGDYRWECGCDKEHGATPATAEKIRPRRAPLLFSSCREGARSRPSRTASVITAVMLSPVSLASSLASFCVFSFLLFMPMSLPSHLFIYTIHLGQRKIIDPCGASVGSAFRSGSEKLARAGPFGLAQGKQAPLLREPRRLALEGGREDRRECLSYLKPWSRVCGIAW